MYPVQGGTQKITINRPDPREYEALKAMQQREAIKRLPDAVSQTRTKYGAVTTLENDIKNQNFSQGSSAANAPETPETTGKIGNGIATSSTVVPDQDPDKVQLDAIMNEKHRRRLDMIARAASNADDSNNNRQQTMRA